jgi:hypothetical protein
MAITRANPHLAEIIEILDMHRAKYRSDAEARDRLTRDDNEWIDNEIYTCMIDRRYMISNYYAYRDEAEGFRGLYPLFDSQEILFEEYRKLEKLYGRVRALVLKARQMGSTTYNCAEFFCSTVFAEHVNSIIVGPDEDTSGYVMGMYESALDFLPWWMRSRTKTRQRGSMIEFDEPNEELRQTRPGLKTWIYADNARKPSGVGRGKTFGRALLTELAFWADGEQLSKALFPTMNTPDGFYVMESTANGRNDFWHNLWRGAEAGKVDWHPIFIPFYRRDKTYSLPILKTEVFVLTGEEMEQRERIFAKESYLIKDGTFKWMRNKKAEFVATHNDDMMFSQEYTSEPEESFQSSAVTAFPRGVINRFAKRTIEPLWVGEISYDFTKGIPHLRLRAVAPGEEIRRSDYEERFHVWTRPEEKAEYCAAVDVALGNPGGDYSTVQVMKKGEGHQLDEQVAVWKGLVDPDRLAEIVLAICWWYNEALAAVEVNSYGMQTNSVLMRNYEYENIYRFKRLDRLNSMMTNIVGWWSDPKSTDALMARMSGLLMDDQVIIRDKYTMDEARDYTEQGAIGKGAHDDLWDALMIACYCMREGEVRERQERKKEAPKDANVFKVKDRWGTVMMTTTNQNDAERFSKKQPGSSIERIAGATASLEMFGNRYRVPADLQNTEFSPIHDKDGTHRRLFEEGMNPEDITPDAVMEADAEEEQDEAEVDPDAWKFQY